MRSIALLCDESIQLQEQEVKYKMTVYKNIVYESTIYENTVYKSTIYEQVHYMKEKSI